jgi:hypothetical protein
MFPQTGLEPFGPHPLVNGSFVTHMLASLAELLGAAKLE